MTEENQTAEVVQETPQETPPVAIVSDEQAKTTGTPEQSSPAAPPVEKTPEQVEKDRAYFQTEMEKTKAELKSLSKESVTPPKEVATPTQPAQQIQGLSNEDLEQKLRDEPLVGMQVIAEHSSNMIKQGFADMKQDAKVEAEFNAQSREANRLVKDFCTKLDISPEILAAADKRVKASGLAGTPSQLANLTLSFAETMKFQQDGAVASTQIAADVAETVKNQQLTVQPATGAPSSPTSISAQDLIANKFKTANPGSDMDRLNKE